MGELLAELMVEVQIEPQRGPKINMRISSLKQMVMKQFENHQTFQGEGRPAEPLLPFVHFIFQSPMFITERFFFFFN